ncbi:bifunctional solanapyrone synthase [Podospora australis]|uniref:Bifunctional solanapyrone synthase n=1 Tax=Podospora australis TaxID=1536484 RepID=A0AAN7AFZ8_9PEZI|nr:bifunctional solanapyrone synthase [Podospora australis]
MAEAADAGTSSITINGAVQALKAALPIGRVHLRGTPTYEKINGAYLSGLESDLRPLLIFQPNSVKEVAAFVQVLRPFVNVVDCAIRGAGQQPLKGCANVDNGITMDLSLLDSITLKDNNSVAQLGAGVRWGAVYQKLDPLGLSVTGSRSALGGVGGLALAGGLAFQSSRQGFITDNVVNFEVVLSSGQVVQANKDTNKDLWIALRGGGNNLGIVTRYDFRTFEQDLIWGGNVFYFADAFPGQIQALVAELTKPNPSDLTHLMISIGYSQQMADAFGVPIMCLNQPYNLEPTPNPPVLDPFTKMAPQIDALNSMSLKNISAAASEQTAAGQAQVRAAYINFHVKADVATLQAISDIYTAALPPLYGNPGATLSLTLQPYPVSLLAKSDASGGNVLGIHASDGPIVSVLILCYWSNKADDAKVTSFMTATIKKMQDDARAKGTILPFIYMNYAFTGQDVINSYGPANKAKLQAASKKYDPVGMFQKAFPGGFKLFP